MAGPEELRNAELEKAIARVLADLPQLLRNFDCPALRIVGGIEELAQEVARAMAKGLPRFAGEEDVETDLRRYVTGIAHNKRFDLLQRAHRMGECVESAVLESAKADNQSPMWIVAKAQVRAFVQECILRLDPDDQLLLRLRLDCGMTMREAAKEMGLTEDAADHRLRRIYLALREMFGSSGNYRS